MGQEKFMKRIVGKTNDVDEALKRLDMLTKEENLLAAARTLEVAQHVDDKVTVIEEVLQDVNGSVRATQELTCHVDQRITATKDGAPHLFIFFIYMTILHYNINR